MAVHSIVILGAGFSGLGTAHYLLRHTIPTLEAKSANKTTYKVTVVTPSTHFFYKIASPRALLGKEDLLPIEKLFVPIQDGFKDYPAEKVALVYGAATAVDESKKTIKIQSNDGPEMALQYDTLVLAAGSKSSTPIWSLHGGHEQSVQALKEMADLLRTAKSVVIAGGGASGVETVGEIKAAYPNMDLTILSGDRQLLSKLSNKGVGQAAESRLKGFGVNVEHNNRVKSTRQSGSQTVMTMTDGSEKTADVYIDSTGSRPNTHFLPKEWLTDRGYVKTDEHSLRGPAEGVYAIGDIASYSLGGILDVMYAVRPLCSTILADLTAQHAGKEAMPEKETPYKQIKKDMQFVPLGPKYGVGVLFGWRIPSFLVWFIKSRTFMIEKAPTMVQGADYVKA